jgi:cytochrome c-type biogenesis protein CcmH/NrfG
MKYHLLILYCVLLTGCQSLQNSGSVTEAVIKEIKQKRAHKQKEASKNPYIVQAEAARVQNPDDPEAWYNQGMAYWQDYEKSVSASSRNEAIKSFQTVLKIMPGNVSTIRALYKIYYRSLVLGDSESFLQATNYFNQLTPEEQKSLNPPSFAQYIYLHYQQEREKKVDYPLLHKTLLQAIQEQPSAEAGYIQLSKLYAKQYHYSLAIATLHLGIENNPDSTDLLKAVASTYEARASAETCHYENSKFIDKASHYYLKAIPLQADSADLHLGLARLFMDRDLPQLSANEMEILLSIQPNAANYAFAAHNYAFMGKKDLAHRYIELAKTEGLLSSDSAYFEVYMTTGDWLKAALSFTDYIQSQKRLAVYDAIKADIITQQSKVNLSRLLDNKELVYANDWQALLYAWWKGEMELEKLASFASNKCEKTELYFYAGYKAMQQGKKSLAKEAFSKSIEQNTYRFIERPLAKRFLSNL